jgi:hypothetical protein
MKKIRIFLLKNLPMSAKIRIFTANMNFYRTRPLQGIAGLLQSEILKQYLAFSVACRLHRERHCTVQMLCFAFSREMVP